MKAWPAGQEVESARVALWERRPIHPDAHLMYGFNGCATRLPPRPHPASMATSLNEIRPIDKGCARTDSRCGVHVLRHASPRGRLRPDVRLMEDADWDRANEVKGLLEEAQRLRRRDMERAMLMWEPAWFVLAPDPVYPARKIHQYKVRMRVGGRADGRRAGTGRHVRRATGAAWRRQTSSTTPPCRRRRQSSDVCTFAMQVQFAEAARHVPVASLLLALLFTAACHLVPTVNKDVWFVCEVLGLHYTPIFIKYN